MTRKSKREIERVLEDLEADRPDSDAASGLSGEELDMAVRVFEDAMEEVPAEEQAEAEKLLDRAERVQEAGHVPFGELDELGEILFVA